MSGKLLELCEPLFQYVCRFNRAARLGGADRLSMAAIRREVEERINTAREAAARSGLRDDFSRIELVLMYFVDHMIKKSNLPWKGKWELLAGARGEFTGDEKFFDLLDEALADPSQSATHRLAVFYVCMGLGFTGFYFNDPQYLRSKMDECAVRLRDLLETDWLVRLCPEAYQHVDRSNLYRPPSRSLTGIVIVLVGLIVTLFVGNALAFGYAKSEMQQALETLSGS